MNRTICGVCGWDKCRCETHPGYVIGSHWLETAYSRVCAGESEAEVLRDYGYRLCAVGQRATQFCGLLEDAVKAEREACVELCLEHSKLNVDDANVEFSHLASYEFGKQVGAATCATAIRARGEA